MQETQVLSLGQKGPLEKVMTTHPSILAWEIPWTEEPGGLQSMGSQRIEHDLATKQQQGKHEEYSEETKSSQSCCSLSRIWKREELGKGKDWPVVTTIRLIWKCSYLKVKARWGGAQGSFHLGKTAGRAGGCPDCQGDLFPFRKIILPCAFISVMNEGRLSVWYKKRTLHILCSLWYWGKIHGKNGREICFNAKNGCVWIVRLGVPLPQFCSC